MPIRLPHLAVAALGVALLAPAVADAQEARVKSRTASESGSSARVKPPKTHAKAATPKKSRKRSFKAPADDADMSRPDPTTTENALSAEPNIPGEDPIARGPKERPSTD